MVNSCVITSQAATILSYVIYDNQGRVARSSSVNAKQFTLDREGLSAGRVFRAIVFQRGEHLP